MAPRKILLAMSGGVDSSASAILLKKQGFEVTGVFLRMQKNVTEALSSAQQVAKQLGIELIELDVRQDFEKEVMRFFVLEYEKNRTPNPCTLCNPNLKFKKIIELADVLKIEKVATGHYAKVEALQGKWFLKKAKNQQKDQSYFLYRLRQKELSRIVFPLGDFQSKQQIRDLAKEHGLAVAEKKDSQNLCFFKKDEKLKEYLKKRINLISGNIVDEAGTVLAQHSGLAIFTRGQRYGLALGGGPFFVIEKKSRENELVVTNNKNHPLLWSNKVSLSQPSWIDEIPKTKAVYTIKTRYRTEATLGSLRLVPKTKKWQVQLQTLQWALASGQALVVYEKDRVIGGGVIEEIDNTY